MKKTIITLMAVGAMVSSYAQGTFNWGNSGTTLVSAGGVATPVLATSQFNFAVFFAPSGTVNALNQNVPLGDAVFTTTHGLNTNTTAIGRVSSRTGVIESSGALGAGSTVDFIIRGWSINAGATYAQALANWNNGSPLAGVGAGMYFGQSVVGNDFVLGGGPIPNSGIVGAGVNQVGGFNLTYFPAPEPSSMALAGLGAASLLIFRRRK
jgi:hypothetical protein